MPDSSDGAERDGPEPRGEKMMPVEDVGEAIAPIVEDMVSQAFEAGQTGQTMDFDADAFADQFRQAARDATDDE